MTMIRLRTLAPHLSLGLLCLGLLSRPAIAEAPDLYTSGLARIEGLYLHRADVQPFDLLVAAGEELEDEIEWLLAEQEGDFLVLRAGDGRELGRVSAWDWESLADGLREVESLVRQAELPLDEVELDVLLLAGAAQALDQHSRVLYGERLQAFDKRLKGTYFGIGARVRTENGRVVLSQVFVDNPAYKAGLRTADELISVDGQSLVGMGVKDITELLIGEQGTQVMVQVRRAVRDEPDGEVLDFVITRDEVREPNVSWKVLVGGFGYIRIDHFSELTEVYLLQGLDELEAQGALERGLVLDLRDNTGGSMLQSAKSADAFVPAGDLVRTVGPDGGKVRGLVEHLWADEDGNEPQIPVVILQNHRTASGSEILAGSLRELDRAVLLGTRSYGKGTVQKVYTLRPDVRLKLTVAQYLLSGGLSIHDEHGVAADLPIGVVRFEPNGVRYLDDFKEPDGPEPLLFVEEQPGWRESGEIPERSDLWEELAVRVLAQSAGEMARSPVLDAAGQVRELVRVEEEERLVATFAARQIDWRAAPELGLAPELSVQVFTREPARAGEAAELVARVTNTGDEPLYRVMVRLESSDRTWTRYVLPVGYLAPGQTSEGLAQVQIPFAAVGRESSVSVVVQSDGRPEVDQGTSILGYEGLPQPQVSVRVHRVTDAQGERAELRVSNHAEHPLQGIRARFEVAPSSGVQLTQYDSLVPSMAADGEVTLQLGIDTSRVDPALQSIPIQLIIETQRFGEIASMAMELPLDGRPVHLRAPQVGIQAPLNAEVGPYSMPIQAQDERGIDHVVVWHQGRKLSWQAGVGRRWEQSLLLDLEPGRNTLVVLAEDDQGLRTWSKVYVRGVPVPVTAEPELSP